MLLESIYALDHAPSFEHYLVDANSKASAVREAVLIREHHDAAEIGVFVAPEVLGRLTAENPLIDLSDERLDDLWLALEGVSHYRYLAFNCGRECRVSLLELELQAEVDKFVTTRFLAEAQGYPNSHAALHDRLFSQAEVRGDLGAELSERYCVASEHAARYCSGLQLFEAFHASTLGQLRDFYRLDRPGKMSLAL